MPLVARVPAPMIAPWPVVVVGAGVAGALVAARLAHAGVSVLLVDRDRFPRSKVCGACLSGKALGVFERSGVPGLAGLPQRLGMVPLRWFRLGAGGNEGTVPLGTGGAVSRLALDAGMLEIASRAGATIWQETEALMVESDNSGATLRLSRQGVAVEVEAGLVVLADGLGGRLSGRLLPDKVAKGSRVGAGCVLGPESAGDYAPGVIHMACHASGYLGMVRQEDGSLDMAMAADKPAMARAGGPAGLARALLESCHWPIPPALAKAPWRGTPPLTRSRVAGAPGMVAVGDAAGYLEPFTGEGMGWALEGAERLSAMVLGALGNGSLESVHGRWADEQQKASRRARLACLMLARALRVPGVAVAAARCLRVFPAIAWPVTWWLDRQSPRWRWR